MPRFVRHRITSKIGNSAGTYDYVFLAPPGSYDGIEGAAITGVVEITSTDDIANQMPLVKVEELLQSAVAVRRKLRVKPAGGKSTYKNVIVAQDIAGSFETNVQGKVSDKGTVQGVVEPLRATYF